MLPSPIVRQAQPKPTTEPARVAPPVTHEQETTPRLRPSRTPKVDHARTAARHSRSARAAHATRGTRTGCRATATSAWCLHGSVIAADDRLRGAYATAIRAGVDPGTLEGVRSDWSRLRRRANKDPEALIRGYGLLTQQLRAEAQRASRR
jgi:hypothetical protein